MAKRTVQEEKAYQFGRACRRRGLTTRQSDLETARRFGIIDNLLDAATDGWNDEDDDGTGDRDITWERAKRYDDIFSKFEGD